MAGTPVLNYERTGKGEPLLLLHGAGSFRRVWDPLLDRLAKQRDVIAVDLPGHGLSPLINDGTAPNPQGFAVIVARFLNALDLETVHIAGNSTGAWVGLELAKMGRARSVTALNPAGLWRWRAPIHTATTMKLAYRGSRLLGPARKPVMDSVMARTITLTRLFARPWLIPADAATAMLTNMAVAPGVEAHLTAANEARFADGQGITVPVTVAWGEWDLLLLPHQARRTDQLPEHTRVIQLAGCGHVPTYDDPSLVARTIVKGSTKPTPAAALSA